MQKTFHFIRTNGQLTRISEEEYETHVYWGNEYEAYYAQEGLGDEEEW